MGRIRCGQEHAKGKARLGQEGGGLCGVRMLKTLSAAVRRRKECRLCFVLSSPRAGSTWLKTALDAHPEVFSTENRFFGPFQAFWPNRDGSRSLRITMDSYVASQCDHFDFEALGLSREQFCDRMFRDYAGALLNLVMEKSGKRLIVDKITPYHDTSANVVAGIRRHFPEAGIVHLVRDGRDVITSGVFDWLGREDQDTQRHAYFVEKRPGATLERFFTDQDLETWARYWVEPIEALRPLRGQILELRYEEMLEQQRESLARLFAHLGVRVTEQILDHCMEVSSFERMSGGRARGQAVAVAKVRKGVAGDWVRYFTRQDGRRFHEQVGPQLMELGYEKDAAWFEKLPETLALPPLPLAGGANDR